MTKRVYTEAFMQVYKMRSFRGNTMLPEDVSSFDENAAIPIFDENALRKLPDDFQKFIITFRGQLYDLVSALTGRVNRMNNESERQQTSDLLRQVLFSAINTNDRTD